MKWSYGVTTCKIREADLLPRTLKSLAAGGFPTPMIFSDYRELGPFANFVFAVWELYLREPNADRYAVFQDDMVCYRNLREYLEKCSYPSKGYWNLLTWPVNVKANSPGWSLSDQWGRGAVGLVFNNQALRILLGADYFVNHPQDSHRGWKSIDRAVMESFREAGWQEWIHNPSLVQHTGIVSTAKNRASAGMESPVFNGEDFDALELTPR